MSTMSFELNFKTENENKMEKLESARAHHTVRFIVCSLVIVMILFQFASYS